ncbi:MAG: response regulator receiver modulated metal dependent phosphohydrolase [Herbinix sp.]|jgi:putative two-component system response regulator|nr:response regulator receiver modulated metal dependent phosphohydrolase [Herbinix sp.]
MDNISYSSPNILVVDDVSANLVVLSEIIRNAGYIARPVTNANQAVSAIEALTPNLILLDVSMPEINGFVFCAMLKKNANTRDIPVIFISALNSQEDKIKGFQLGAVDYISKPFEVEEVTLRINTHLKMYKMQQELEIYNKKLYKIINDQIRKIYEEQKNVVQALTIMCSLKDDGKTMHMERVGKNSRLLAMSLQLSAKYREIISNSFVDTIETAACLHDIGKMAISDAIIFKSGGLTVAEKEIIRTHTTFGANILEEIYSYNENNEFIKMAIDIVKYHHERWNGTGYPAGISGTAIPLSARIVSVIDVYDSLISKKSYRPEYSHEMSMHIINDGSGILFDPDIVNVFNKIQSQLKK